MCPYCDLPVHVWDDSGVGYDDEFGFEGWGGYHSHCADELVNSSPHLSYVNHWAWLG